MNIVTNEVSDFKNEKALKKALENNPYLVEVDCNQGCEFRESRFERYFCIANRKQRRKIKCQIKRIG